MVRTQETLGKSNQICVSYKAEMDKVTKQATKLAKENQQLRGKCDSTSQGAVQLATRYAAMEKQLAATTERAARLEKLCRALQQLGHASASADASEQHQGQQAAEPSVEPDAGAAPAPAAAPAAAAAAAAPKRRGARGRGRRRGLITRG
jgi:hypothetical protein